MDQLYATDYVKNAAITASRRRDAAVNEPRLIDGNLNTCWTPAGGKSTGYVEFDLGKARSFNLARIQENIALGERVQAYHVEVLEGGKWRAITAGRVIGHKQLRRFTAVTAQRVRLVIDQASAPPAIAEFGLHFNSVAPGG
jgi:alpha-L-fucosidase